MKNEINKSFEIRSPGISAILRHFWVRSQGSISLILVWICVAVFLGVAFLDIVNVANRQQIVFFLGISRIGVLKRLLLHQFVTAPLLHRNITHLLFNMLTLWILGPGVENALGRKHYILFSLLCALCSMVGFLFINSGTGNIALGYSGVIFGILVAQAMYFPNNTILMFYFFAMKMKYAVLILSLVELYLTISPQEGGIVNAAHLFGAIGAFVYLKALRRWQLQRKRRRRLMDYLARPKHIHRRKSEKIPWEL